MGSDRLDRKLFDTNGVIKEGASTGVPDESHPPHPAKSENGKDIFLGFCPPSIRAVWRGFRGVYDLG